MDKEFQCCQCQQEFNLHDRNPLVLPSCGHSICQLCVTQYLQSESQLICKEDNHQCQMDRELKNFPINQSIIALLRKQRTNHKSYTYVTPDDAMQRMVGEDVSEFSGEGHQHHSLVKSSFCTNSCDRLPNRELPANYCTIHHKEIELVCQEDGQYICVNCALFGEHKFHNYKPIDVYIKEMEQTFEETTKILEDVQNYRQQIEQSQHLAQFEQKVNQAKEESLTKLDLKFSELFNELILIKEEMKTKMINNFMAQQEESKKKFIQEFNNLKVQADSWLQHTGELLLLRCNFVEKNQGKQFTIEKKVLDDGRLIAEQIVKKMNGIENVVQYIKMQQEFFIPIENIKRQFTCDDHHKQHDQLLLDKEEKLMDSDIIYHDLKDEKLTQSNQFSQQPTQPTSPQYNMGKNNFFSQTFTPGTFDRKDRSITVLQTEPNEVQHQNTNRNKLSHSKFAKIQKFSQNPRMNEKILSTLALLDKFEMVDFGQIDMSESLINAMDEGLKGKKVVKVLKMGKCKITDDIFAKLLQAIEESSVTALHLQSNLLTEKSLDILLGIVKSKQIECKQIYMNTNAISSAKGKKKIDELKKYGIQILI